jgi:hypothetical protein
MQSQQSTGIFDIFPIPHLTDWQNARQSPISRPTRRGFLLALPGPLQPRDSGASRHLGEDRADYVSAVLEKMGARDRTTSAGLRPCRIEGKMRAALGCSSRAAGSGFERCRIVNAIPRAPIAFTA